MSTRRRMRNRSIETSDSDYNASLSLDSDRLRNGKLLWSLKGLSHQIKALVLDLKQTTYKELAQILIDRLQTDLQLLSKNERKREVQNLKRRVYDAINVMVAMEILSKDKKIISIVESAVALDTVQPIEQLMQRQHHMKMKRGQFTLLTSEFMMKERLVARNQVFSRVCNEQKVLPLLALSVNIDHELLISQRNGNQILFKAKCPISMLNCYDIIKVLHI